MMMDVFMALISLVIILLGCAVFTNAVEWLGKILGAHQGMVGSVFAAVGTALPETMVPIVAILFSSGAASSDIAIGAIAGAPFMLGTLGFLITGTAVLAYSAAGRRSIKITVNEKVMQKDLSFFIGVYGLAIAAAFLPALGSLRIFISMILLLAYVWYIKSIAATSCEHVEEPAPLYLSHWFKLKRIDILTPVQLVIALGIIIFGAHLFITEVEQVAGWIGISPLILSLIVTPIATELPEKMNSVLWIRQSKDTMAIGNLTGAMVFQSSIPVTIGLLFTPWQVQGAVMVSALLALGAAAVQLIWLRFKGGITPASLLMGGLLYVVFLLYLIGSF